MFLYFLARFPSDPKATDLRGRKGIEHISTELILQDVSHLISQWHCKLGRQYKGVVKTVGSDHWGLTPNSNLEQMYHF